MPANAEETRAQLIRAAERLFADKGIEATSLREVNREAGKTGDDAVAVAVAVDCSNSDAVANAAEHIQANYGVPDILVNNAGVGQWLALWESDDSVVQSSMGAPFLCSVYLYVAHVCVCV